MKRTFDDLPGWTFDVEEVSANVYEATGTPVRGRWRVRKVGTDPDAVLEMARSKARSIETEGSVVAVIAVVMFTGAGLAAAVSFNTLMGWSTYAIGTVAGISLALAAILQEDTSGKVSGWVVGARFVVIGLSLIGLKLPPVGITLFFSFYGAFVLVLSLRDWRRRSQLRS